LTLDVRRIEQELSARFDLDPLLFDRGVFSTSHATQGGGVRAPIGEDTRTRGMEAAVADIVAEIDARLRRRYARAYSS
jgi:hypothetical protein